MFDTHNIYEYASEHIKYTYKHINVGVVMDNTFANSATIKNIESPFTELFSLLKRYDSLPDGSPMLAYKSDALKIIHQHIDNAMDVLLHGLQDMGRLLSVATEDKKNVIEELHNIGFFISGITNLTEALNILRMDTDHVLSQRGEMNY